MYATTTIRRAGTVAREAVLAVLTEAFTDDPLACWLFPEPGERPRLQSRFYRHQLDHPAAETYLIGDDEGVSLWHTLGGTADEDGSEPHSPDREDAFGASGTRLRALGQVLASRHPVDEPHRYLFCMGVIGGRQGAGLGSAMLRHGLEQVDADGLPAYLEASSSRSRALYLRHGFEDLGEPVRLADSPPLWPMWRPPRR